MKQEHNITLEDACHVWLNLPDWVRFYENIDNPMFLGTLSIEGDEKVRMHMFNALGMHRLNINVTGNNIDKRQAWKDLDAAALAICKHNDHGKDPHHT